MAGNDFEKAADWFSEEYYAFSPPVDPHGLATGKHRIARGGGGFINPKVQRISTRLSAEPRAGNATR